MKKRIMAVVVTAAMVMGALAGCGSSSTKKHRHLHQQRQHQKLLQHLKQQGKQKHQMQLQVICHCVNILTRQTTHHCGR